MVDFRKHMNLLVGFFVTSTVIILLLVVLMILATKGVFNPEYRLLAIFNDGVGLRRGTAVLFNGVGIGSVDKLQIIPGSGTHTSQVRLTLLLDQKYQDFITSQSLAIIMRDKNLVSDRVINIETPQLGGRILKSGDTLKVTTARDIETVLTSLNDLMHKITNLVEQAEFIVTKINDSNTTLGAVLNSGRLYANMERELKNVSVIVQGGQELVGRSNRLGQQLENSLPGMIKNADTSLVGVKESVRGLDTLLNEFGKITQKADILTGQAKGLMDEGKGEMEQAGQLLDALSDFWFIRGKIKKQNESEVPLFMGESAP